MKISAIDDDGYLFYITFCNQCPNFKNYTLLLLFRFFLFWYFFFLFSFVFPRGGMRGKKVGRFGMVKSSFHDADTQDDDDYSDENNSDEELVMHDEREEMNALHLPLVCF